MSDPDWLRIAREKGLIESERPHVFNPEPGPNPVPGLPDKSLPEKDFTQTVIDLARKHGWLTAHFRTSRITRQDGSVYYETAVQGDGAGFPDLVLVRDRVLFVELKSDAGSLREEQKTWRDRLEGARQQWFCWRPRDWKHIVEELT